MDKEELPVVEISKLNVLGDPIKVKFESPVPTKTGTYESKYGPREWNLWICNVNNVTVTWGRKEDKEEEEGYSGKAMLFAPTTLSNKLVSACNNRFDVEVEIKKVATETKKGVITTYDVVKTSNGEERTEKSTKSSGLPANEEALVSDAKALKSKGFKSLTEAVFIQAAKEDKYGKITEAKAKELYKLV